MRVRVKICGLTRADDARRCAELGADFIGLNFHPQSPRFVDVEQARAVRDAIGGRVRVVGVFVNARRDYIAERLERVSLDLLQFHGDEDESELVGWPVPTIRALRLRNEAVGGPLPQTGADYLLLDRFHERLFGGTGQALAFERLRGCDLGRVFISGGLTPETVAAAVALKPYAVDVASGVESAPGVKDDNKLRSFLENAKSSR